MTRQLDATRDLIVIVPGIMGSTLSKDGDEAWGLSAGSIVRAIRTLGRSIGELALPVDIGDDDPRDGVVARSLMPDLHIIPGLWSASVGYDRLVKSASQVLAASGAPISESGLPENLLLFPYDWRLSNRLNGRRLDEAVEPALTRLRARGGEFSDSEVTFICHSMGGLVARWYIEMEGGHETTRKLITMGTPFRGSTNALRDLVNGVRKGFGSLGADLTYFARSLPAAHQLLPQYSCIEAGGGLASVVDSSLPGIDTRMVMDGARFHADMDRAATDRDGPALHPIVGHKQPTATTARLIDDRLETIETIEGADEGGDATVPRLSAAPRSLRSDDASIRPVAEHHGALQANRSVLDGLEGTLTATRISHRAAPSVDLRVSVSDMALVGEVVEVRASRPVTGPAASEREPVLAVKVYDEAGREVATRRLDRADGIRRTELRLAKAGGYRVEVGGMAAHAGQIQSVSAPLLVWDGAADER